MCFLLARQVRCLQIEQKQKDQAMACALRATAYNSHFLQDLYLYLWKICIGWLGFISLAQSQQTLACWTIMLFWTPEARWWTSDGNSRLGLHYQLGVRPWITHLIPIVWAFSSEWIGWMRSVGLKLECIKEFTGGLVKLKSLDLTSRFGRAGVGRSEKLSF